MAEHHKRHRSGYSRARHGSARYPGEERDNRPQHVDDFSTSPFADIFMIPWGHHRVIIDRCKSDSQKALLYVHQILANNWSRAVLLNWLDTELYERQGKAITNFTLTFPVPQSDLVQEISAGCFLSGP